MGADLVGIDRFLDGGDDRIAAGVQVPTGTVSAPVVSKASRPARAAASAATRTTPALRAPSSEEPWYTRPMLSYGCPPRRCCASGSAKMSYQRISSAVVLASGRSGASCGAPETVRSSSVAWPSACSAAATLGAKTELHGRAPCRER
jgi:hypothetical protein